MCLMPKGVVPSDQRQGHGAGRTIAPTRALSLQATMAGLGHDLNPPLMTGGIGVDHRTLTETAKLCVDKE